MSNLFAKLNRFLLRKFPSQASNSIKLKKLSSIVSGISIVSAATYLSFNSDELSILCENVQDISKRLITVSPETSLFLWGNNYYGVANPLSDSLSVKSPSPLEIPGTRSLSDLKMTLSSLYTSQIKISDLKQLFGSRIKSVTMAQKHAACIDPSGNLVQWGHGFNGLLSLIEVPQLSEDTSILSSIPLNEKKDHSGLPQPNEINRLPESTVLGYNLTHLTSTKEHILAVNDQVLYLFFYN